MSRDLQWQPFIAYCSMCLCEVQDEDIVLGRQHPLAPNAHFCPACAKALHINEYDSSGNLIRSHYARTKSNID